MVRHETDWNQLMAVGDGTAVERERAARHALGDSDRSGGDPDDLTFPMIVAGTTIGVLGVAGQPTLENQQRRVLTAAAALLAVSLKNAELFRQVHENSVRDALTGCYNKTHALEVMSAELRRARDRI